MRARALLFLAAALPLLACAAPPGAAPGTAQAVAPAIQDTRPHDAGHEPASAIQAPANRAAPAAPRAVAPDAASDMTAATTVGDRGTGAGTGAEAGEGTPGAAPATPAAPLVVAPAAPASPVAVAPVTMPSGSATGSLLQTMFALVAVLALLAAMAWFLKRYGPRTGGGTANLRIVGSLGLGGRERLLVVEVGDQWIVVGASPGRVNALATMPRQEGATAAPGGATLAPHTQSPANNFADWLKQTIDKRK